MYPWIRMHPCHTRVSARTDFSGDGWWPVTLGLLANNPKGPCLMLMDRICSPHLRPTRGCDRTTGRSPTPHSLVTTVPPPVTCIPVRPSPRYSTASTYHATLLISHINQLWNAECSHTALDLNTRQHGHIWPKRVAGQSAGTSLSVHVSDPDVEAASVRRPRCCQSALSEHTERFAAARLWALHCSTVLEILHGCAPLSWTEQVEARRCYLRASTSERYPCTGSAQPAQVVDRAPAQGKPRGGHQRTAGAYKRARQAMGKGETLTS
jgi:hypothetical protein